MKGGQTRRFNGSSALARELGLTQSYVSRKFGEGMTAEQLREQARRNGGARQAKKKMAAVVKKKLGHAGSSKLVTSESGGYVAVRGKRLDLATAGTVVTPGRMGEIEDRSPRRSAAASEPRKPIDEVEPDADEVDDETADIANYYKSRARNEQAKARERELIVAQRESAMVYRSQVDIWVRGMILKARNMLTRIGPDLQDRLAMETVPAKCGKLVSDEIQQALEALVEYDG